MNEEKLETDSVADKAALPVPGAATLTNSSASNAMEQSDISTQDQQPNVVVPTSTTNPEDQKKKLTEIKDQGESFGKVYENAGLWDILCTCTKNIEIEDDENFYWPENRKATEEVLKQLLIRRILFVRSVSENWMYTAVQRLASVLQSNGWLENVLIRITKSDFIIDKTGQNKLSFAFWVNQQKLPSPTVVFISSERQDFIEKFLGASRETLLNELLTGLKKSNLFIVCEVDETKTDKNLLQVFQKKAHPFFATWEVPCFKLSATQKFGKSVELLMKGLSERSLMDKIGHRTLYEGLMGIQLNSTTEISDTVFNSLEDYRSDIDEKATQLINLMEASDFVSQLAIFCGAFFDGLYYPDFYKLVAEMLLMRKDTSTKTTPATSASEIASNTLLYSAEKFSLSEQWENNTAIILRNCFLETRLDGGNQRVCFVIPKLADVMSEYIQTKQYSLFYNIYSYFQQRNFLIRTDLSDNLEQSVIKFFAVAARMDMATHNAFWLKEIVHGLWNSYENNMPANMDYDQVKLYLLKERELGMIVFVRIPLIIGGLLKNSNEHFKPVVKDLFHLLLNESNTKKIVIIITSYLYKEYRYTEIFSHDDLLSYFQRTLEEGKWDDSFFAYDAMAESMDYLEFNALTKKWITDNRVSDGSWTKHFAFLYQVDFILVTVYRYFRQFKTEATYELWETENHSDYPESFKELMSNLLCKQSFKSLDIIFNNNEGYKRFTNFVRYFEAVESRKMLLVAERFQPPNDEAFSLIADILEMWFYIMVHKDETIDLDTAMYVKWKTYGELVIKYCDESHFRQIRKFWSVKIQIYNIALTEEKDEIRGTVNKPTVYMNYLKKRKSCLKKLKDIIQLSILSNPLK